MDTAQASFGELRATTRTSCERYFGTTLTSMFEVSGRSSSDRSRVSHSLFLAWLGQLQDKTSQEQRRLDWDALWFRQRTPPTSRSSVDAMDSAHAARATEITGGHLSRDADLGAPASW